MISNDILLMAISWTLLHSIWQGILFAILGAVVILLTRKSAAVLRYNLLSVLFVGFIVVVGFTFNHEFHNENTETITRLNFPKLVGYLLLKYMLSISLQSLKLVTPAREWLAKLWTVSLKSFINGIWRIELKGMAWAYLS